MTLPRGISRISDAVVSSSSAPEVLYMGVGALNTGAVCTTTSAPVYTSNGIPVTASGQVCVTAVPTPPLYSSGGLLYDSTGRLNAVDLGAAIWPLNFSNSFLMDSTGSIVLVAGGPAPPTPILLDTFTAANGTDPTSRDMDVHPAGAARWQSAPTDLPIIESNSLMGVINGSGRNAGALKYSLPSNAQIFDASDPYAVLLCVTASSAVFLEILASNTSTAGKVNLYWNGSVLEFDAVDDAFASFNLSYPYVTTGGAEKFAFWTDGTNGHMIINGASVANGSYGLGASGINEIFPYLGSTSAGVTVSIDSVGFYGNITLSQAIALTA